MSENIKEWKSKTIPELNVSMDEISNYLNMEYQIYRALDTEELLDIVWTLKRYSLYLQKEYNEENSRARWCYNTIMKIGKPLATNYGSYDKDERLQSAVRENEALRNIQEKKIDSESKAAILDGMSRSVSYLTNMLEKLAFYKLERKKNESTGQD